MAICLHHGLADVGFAVVGESWKFLAENARDTQRSLLLRDADTGENLYAIH